MLSQDHLKASMDATISAVNGAGSGAPKVEALAAQLKSQVEASLAVSHQPDGVMEEIGQIFDNLAANSPQLATALIQKANDPAPTATRIAEPPRIPPQTEAQQAAVKQAQRESGATPRLMPKSAEPAATH